MPRAVILFYYFGLFPCSAQWGPVHIPRWPGTTGGLKAVASPCPVPHPNARSLDFNARLTFDGKCFFLAVDTKPGCCGLFWIKHIFSNCLQCKGPWCEHLDSPYQWFIPGTLLCSDRCCKSSAYHTMYRKANLWEAGLTFLCILFFFQIPWARL